MRFETTIASISWIPSEGIPGLLAVPFDRGLTHYDRPVPDAVDHAAGPEDLLAHDGARFANVVTAWIDVDDETGRIVGAGQDGRAVIADTTVRLGRWRRTFRNHPAPLVRSGPIHGDGWVRLTQTAGGRTNLPAPRRLHRPPFVGLVAPPVWTTLAVTLHADGRVDHELVGASPFPRHWVYGPDGRLSAKSGQLQFRTWYRRVGRRDSPWRDRELPVTAVPAESSAERELSERVMAAAPALRRTLRAGAVLARQGAADDRPWLVLDGVLTVEVDGEQLGVMGPGSVVGERAGLHGGRRTATVRAMTDTRLVAVGPEALDEQVRRAVADHHRREDLVGHG